MASILRGGICIVGLWTSFLFFGWAQEAVTRPRPERFPGVCTLIFLQSVGNASVSFLILKLFKSSGKGGVTAGVPWKDWYIAGLAYLAAQVCGQASLQYIIYPLQVLMKSCKMVPVLLGTMIIAKKTYPLAKILMVILLTMGVVVFTMGQPSKKSSGSSDAEALVFGMTRSTFGIGLATLSLIGDGIYGPLQDKIISDHQPSSYHLMFNMNFFQAQWALLAVLAFNEIPAVLEFVQLHNEIVVQILVYALTMALGQLFLFQLQAEFGSLVVCTATTTRKFFTILLSVFVFGHFLVPIQWVGVGMVFLALSYEIFAKWQTKRLEKPKKDMEAKED